MIKYYTKLLIVLSLIFYVSNLHAGITGKISGRVIDSKTGEPIAFASVVLVGKNVGAASNLDGYYTIINIPPGTYTVKASAIGYNERTKEGVVVKVDLTTKEDFSLSDKTVELQDVVTIAEKPLVQKDMTATTSVVGSELIDKLPVTEIRDVLTLQAGVTVSAGGDIHLRGGRKGQIAYQIDGVTITDAYDNSSVIEVGTSSIQELQVISGAFNAEYGQAMSGVVNIVTKDGDNNFTGNLQVFFGDNLSTRKELFWNIEKIDPINIMNYDLSLSGPIIKDNLFFFANGRYYKSKGYLYGRQVFLTTDQASEIKETPGKYTITQHGDSQYVAMNPNERIYGQGKLTFKLTSEMRIGYNFIYDKQKYKDYDFGNRLTPDNNLERFRNGMTNTLSLNHTISSNSFYTLNLSYFNKDYKHYLFEDIYTGNAARPTLYVDNDIRPTPPYSFAVGGTNTSRFNRNTATMSARLDWTTQVNQEVAVKFGGEVKQHKIFYEEIYLQPMLTPNGQKTNPYNVAIPPSYTTNNNSYTHKPFEASGYVQTKVEMFNMIINAGFRFDLFNPDASILADPTDPNILNPLKPENKAKSLDERYTYWYKKASTKFQVSPRVGIAFPISDQGVIHFSYGHFLQLPSYELLYSNPEFELGINSGNAGLFGNADLKPQKTVKGEIGVQQGIGNDISLDITMFFEDFRDLTGTQTEEILVHGGAQTYSIYANSDFGFSKGVTFKLEKRFSGGFAVNLDYTYSITKGNSSNPADARNAVLGGAVPETYIAPLDWDQTHTLNLVAAYTKPRDYGFSLIGNFYSGQPYTPQVNKNTRVAQNAFPRNSGNKPNIFNIDLRAYKDFTFGNTTLSVFLRVFNLLDSENPRVIYGDTGDPTFTFGKLDAVKVNPTLYYNTIDDLYRNPGFFTEPRRVEIGFSYSF